MCGEALSEDFRKVMIDRCIELGGNEDRVKFQQELIQSIKSLIIVCKGYVVTILFKTHCCRKSLLTEHLLTQRRVDLYFK